SRLIRLPSSSLGQRAQAPVGKEGWLSLCEARQEPPCSSRAAAQPLVLPRRPTNKVVVDMSERADQRRRIETAVVVDPPPHDRIAEPCEVSEGHSTPEMQPPALGRLSDRFRGLATHRRTEADKQPPAPAPRSARAKRVAEEIKRLVLV